MEELKHLQRAEFERVIHSGKDLILFFYNKEGDAASTLGVETMKEINSLVGKSFDLYLIDVLAEPDIVAAFSVKIVPEYVSMKRSKIYKRSSDLLQASEVLALLK